MNRSLTVECTTQPPIPRPKRRQGLAESDQVVKVSYPTRNNEIRRSISPRTNKKAAVVNASCTMLTRNKDTIRHTHSISTRAKMCAVPPRPVEKLHVAHNSVRTTGISPVVDALLREGSAPLIGSRSSRLTSESNKRHRSPLRKLSLTRKKDVPSKVPNKRECFRSPNRPQGSVSPPQIVRKKVVQYHETKLNERLGMYRPSQSPPTHQESKISDSRRANGRRVRFYEKANEYFTDSRQIDDAQIATLWYNKVDIAQFQLDIKETIQALRLTEAYWCHPQSLPGTLLRMYLTFRHAQDPGEVTSPVTSSAAPIHHSPYLIGLESTAIRIIAEDYMHRRQCLLLQLRWVQSQLPHGMIDQSTILRAAFRESSRTSRLFARYIADLSFATPWEDLVVV